MKHSARIATASALLALICASQAQAVRSIRTDMQTWLSCADPDTCAFWDDGTASAPLYSMLLNPLDSTTLLDPNHPADLTNWAVTYISGADERNDAPAWKLTNGDAQFIYYYLGTDSWIVEFNYPFDFDADAEAPLQFPLNGAAFQWNDSLYTVSYQSLVEHSGLNDSNDFRFNNGTLLAPSHWTLVSGPVANVPEPGTLALLMGALGLAFTLRRRRNAVPLLQGA